MLHQHLKSENLKKPAELTLFSPAKLNLFLRVLNRREDGYHNLASLFQAIDLGDHLTFAFSTIDKFSSSDPTLPRDESNLVWKAVNLFRRKLNLGFSVNIHLEKRIPLQAGLGGGSSNAATTLWALNRLCEQALPNETLASWAAEIGSDISFFFSQGTAYCTGRGEQVKNLPSIALEKPLWLVKPLEGLSTPVIFKALDLKECSSANPETLLESHLKGTPIFHNDLENAACRSLPMLMGLKKTLYEQGFHPVMMTGSGTAFFCFGPKKPTLPETIQCYSIHYIYRTTESWY